MVQTATRRVNTFPILIWNLKSLQPERFASWNRFRWTVDIDFGALTGHDGLYFHATTLWQAGGNLGA